MKVLYVIEGGLPYGSNRSLIGLIKHFHNIGLEMSVVGKDDGIMKQWVESLGLMYFPMNVEFFIYPRFNTLSRKLLFPLFLMGRITTNLITLIKIIALCRKIKPDLIHTNVGPISVGYYASRILKIKHVWHLREFQDLDFGMKFFPSKNSYTSRLKRSDCVICVSKAVARHFNQSQESVIYNGVYSRSCAPPIKNKENYLLFAANLQPSKGIEEALSAYLKLKVLDQTGIKFFIIGDGKPEYVDKLKSIAGEQMRNGNIQFFGYRDDIPRWMQRAKAVIVASEHEGFGRVAAEAMFNGSLVVGKKSAGTAELLEPWHGSQIALLFMDEESLVERMIEAAFMDGGRYTQTVLAAQQKAVECFSIEGNAEHVLEIYTRLVNLPEQPT